MAEQERPLVDRIWEMTKDLSVKVSRKAEKHWKINTLRVEIGSIRRRINNKYKELGRFFYESVKSGALDEEVDKTTFQDFFDELGRLEAEIVEREQRIEILEEQMRAEAEGTGEEDEILDADTEKTEAKTAEDDAEASEDAESTEKPEEKSESAEDGDKTDADTAEETDSKDDTKA